MSENDVLAHIESAFAEYADISATKYWDEGIVDYFRGTSWCGHSVRDLRRHHCALSYFTDKAFRYWLPAFMIAELEDPTAADVIAESIVFSLTNASAAEARLRQLAPAELAAIVGFLHECVQRYGSICFRDAEKIVCARIRKGVHE